MKSNLALITTLYNSKGADFYKDIYFPLIRLQGGGFCVGEVRSEARAECSDGCEGFDARL